MVLRPEGLQIGERLQTQDNRGNTSSIAPVVRVVEGVELPTRPVGVVGCGTSQNAGSDVSGRTGRGPMGGQFGDV